jgi:hypothetical protein
MVEMITDCGLEYNKQWEAIANEGIGGPDPYVAPTIYKVTPANIAPNLAVTIVGGSYTDMMAATHRPLMPVFDPKNIYYSLSYNINIDPNTPTQGQALESEANYCHIDAQGKCWYYPSDLQFNIEKGWMIQGFTWPEPWLDTEFKIAPFKAGVPCPVKINYLVDTIDHNVSTLSVVVNGILYTMPAAFQKVAAQQLTPVWAPGIYVQFQLDLASKGGSMTNIYTNVCVNWE